MTEPKDATSFTEQANQSVCGHAHLDWTDQADFEDARRGFIARLEDPVIKTAEGRAVWDLHNYSFLEEEQAPPTVNPSLWRQARLNMFHGLFKVVDGIYQVRGYDLSVMSIIETDSGYIVIDPLISVECAAAAFQLVREHVGDRPVVAVIYTHSHIDHWGGVKGIISEKDVESGRVQVIAPEGFTEAAVSENIMAGNAMARRATYMYGNLIAPGPRGQVDAGLGKVTSSGNVSLILPTVTIEKTPTTLNVDGLEIVFQLAPDTEAPAEMHFHFPRYKALCIAENCTHTLHNLYTLRGAKVRDAQAWAHYVNEAMEMFGGDTDVVFASHHWPTWGRERCLEFLARQRDMYKYLHDQVLNLANQGYTMLEIAEVMELPPKLAGAWYNRGYYGSVNHDAKAIYQRYLGWFDGNPANLHPLPPEESSARYLEFMGGADAALAKAREAYDKGDYRWVAQVVNHVVFAEPDNREARELQADALEQLGYQAESGPWRNFYLTGALELREGVDKAPNVGNIRGNDVQRAMTLEMIFDYMAVSLDGRKAADKVIDIRFVFSDLGQEYLLRLENGVLNHFSGRREEAADVTITLTRGDLDLILAKSPEAQQRLASGEVKMEGAVEKLGELFSLMTQFDTVFNIVTP